MRKLNALCFALVFASTVRARSTPGVNNAELKGDYAFTFNGMTTGGGGASTVFAAAGRFTTDGAIPTGNITGTEDIGAASGPSFGVAANATYSVSSLPTNGRGSTGGSIGGSGIVYVVSTSKFVVVSLSDPNPAVLIFEQ